MVRIFRSLISVMLVFFVHISWTGSAIASCGSANCFLVTGTQEGIANPGQIILDLSYRWIPMDRIQRGSDSASEALVPRVDFANGVIVPDGHSEIRTNNELAQLDVSYGVSPKAALTLAIPFFNLRTHEHAHVPGDFTRQDGTSGFGDIRLIGKYAPWVTTKQLLVFGLGVKTPTGEYKLLDHEGEINEPTIQPGTGSWDGLISAYYAYQIRPHRLDAFVSGSYQLSGENDLDYRFGNVLILNGGANYLFSSQERPVTASLQLNLRQSPHDEFKGEEVPSTGGTWVYLTPGVKIQPSPHTSFYTHVQLPVHQDVNEVNIVPRYGWIMGVSYAF
ncbi:MAG: transporter [Nitrospirae bacterium]|nr:transporter [Nitrospirota bacterium]